MSAMQGSINTAAVPSNVAAPSVTSPNSTLTIEIGDGAQFRAALERHLKSAGNSEQAVADPSKVSFGDKMVTRASELAGDMKAEHQNVSKMLETATRTGDQQHLMKALMALNDYQLRAQFASKMISKATGSIDQLTRMQ